MVLRPELGEESSHVALRGRAFQQRLSQGQRPRGKSVAGKFKAQQGGQVARAESGRAELVV